MHKSARLALIHEVLKRSNVPETAGHKRVARVVDVDLRRDDDRDAVARAHVRAELVRVVLLAFAAGLAASLED